MSFGNLDEAKDAATAAATGFLGDIKQKMSKFVTLAPGNPEVTLQLRKKLDVEIPFAPDLRFSVGTDLTLCNQDAGNFGKVAYVPNFQWDVTETWFNGQIRLNTGKKELYYTKDFDLDAVILKVSGTYDYANNAPYFGVQVVTTSGVCSPANTNGFSIKKTIEKTAGPAKVEAEIEATIAMGKQFYNPKEGSISSSPAELDVNNVRLLVTV